MKRKGVLVTAVAAICIASVFAAGGFFLGGVYADESETEIPEEKLRLVSDNCDTIKTNLKTVQKNDARARVYLGSYYEKILTKYITALNVKLIESNNSDTSLIENQNKYAKAKSVFSDDYIAYQKKLEDLIAVDCKSEPKKFYEELIKVRKKQAVIVQDTAKLSSILVEHKELVNKLKAKL
ncbi:hypothetical protein J5491_00865 [Candidatus Saccharibacteria bacterium]|nr:hypothetical protein [Candidatus Saccharibacteria bacterium]